MPESTVHIFSDPDAYHAAIRDTHAEGIVTGRGNFRAESTSVRLDRLSIQRSAETLPRIAHSAIDPKLFAIGFATHPDQQAYINSLELSHDHLVVFGPGSMGHNRSSAACQWGSIALRHEDIAAVGGNHRA